MTVIDFYLVDDELVAKVASELQMEKEMRDPNELPTSIKDYLENTPFKARLQDYQIIALGFY
jgi:hypothetical protein